MLLLPLVVIPLVPLNELPAFGGRAMGRGERSEKVGINCIKQHHETSFWQLLHKISSEVSQTS